MALLPFAAKTAIFVATGILSTICAQVLIYAGAGDSWTMLLPFSNYFGMLLAGFVPDALVGSSPEPGAEKPEKPPASASPPAAGYLGALLRLLDVPRGAASPRGAPPGTLTVAVRTYVLIAIGADIAGFWLHVQGIKYAGSALFQVVYCSVVVVAALGYWFARTPRGSRLLLGAGLAEFVTPPLPGGEAAPGAELTPAQQGGIALVLGGLAVVALNEGAGGAPGSGGVAFVLYGLACSVACAVCYGGVYTFAELLMGAPAPPRAQAVAARVGGGICALLGAYILLFVAPRAGAVGARVAAVGLLSLPQVALGYGIMVASAVAHSITYFQLMGQAGAVSTSVMAAARAVGVFVVSAALFCASAGRPRAAGVLAALAQESQCYTAARGVATAAVCVGIVVYAKGKAAAAAAKAASSAHGSGSSSAEEEAAQAYPAAAAARRRRRRRRRRVGRRGGQVCGAGVGAM